ncbi:histidine phosphatase family protein [bacterium]|nr:histidine phosphatase family protein [bacterium]
MQLYLLRHGQSQNNVGKTSAHNVPMTELGHEQIRRATDALADRQFYISSRVPSGEKIRQFDALYCSPLDRALQTATILHSKLNLTPYVHPDFSEVGFCWGEPNATLEQLQSSYPCAVMDASISNNGWAPVDSETEDEAYERAGKVVHFLSARHPAPNARVLVVSHGRFGSILIGYLVGGVRPCGYSRYAQNNGGISLVEITNETIQLRFLNITAHLPGELLT